MKESSGLSFVVATERTELTRALRESGRVTVKAAVESLPELGQAVARHQPDALFVDLEPEAERALAHLESLPAPRPLLFVQGPDDPGLIRRALRLGAREYLAPSEEPKRELLTAVERLLAERRAEAAADGEPGSAPLLAVLGAKGGVGATFVACQLAAGLADRGARVSMLDAHLRLGDVALYLDLHPRYTIASLASATDAVDVAYLQTVLSSHRSGVQVLAAPERPEEADVVALEHVDRALGILRRENDWVIVDTPGDFDERSVHVLDRATGILLVTTCDVPALNHARLQLDLLQRLGYSPHKVRVVVNRMDRKTPVQGGEITDFLNRRFDLSLPNDYPTTAACVNEGRSLQEIAPRSSLCAAIDELATAAHGWCGVAPSKGEGGRPRSLLARLRRKRNGAS